MSAITAELAEPAAAAAEDSQKTVAPSSEGDTGNKKHFSSRAGNLSEDDIEKIMEAAIYIKSAIEEEIEKSLANVASGGDVDRDMVFNTLPELRLEEYNSGSEEYHGVLKCKVVDVKQEGVLMTLDDLHKSKQIHQDEPWSGILKSISTEKAKFPSVMILFHAVCTEETQIPDAKKEKSFDLPVILDDKALRIVVTIDGKEHVIND